MAKVLIFLALVAATAALPVGPAIVSRTVASDHVVHPGIGLHGLHHGLQGLHAIHGMGHGISHGIGHDIQSLQGIGGGGYYGGLVGAYPGGLGNLGVHQTISSHSIAHVPQIGYGGLYKGYYGGYFPGSFGIGYGNYLH